MSDISGLDIAAIVLLLTLLWALYTKMYGFKDGTVAFVLFIIGAAFMVFLFTTFGLIPIIVIVALILLYLAIVP